MSYIHAFEEQQTISQKEFEAEISYIENTFTAKNSKPFKGLDVFYLRGAFDQTIFVKTTVSDLREVCANGINFTWISEDKYFCNPIVSRIREPKKGEFRGRLKFVPSKTFTYELSMLCPTKNGSELESNVMAKYPILQDEQFLNTTCDKAYENDENGVDYDYIMRNCNKVLYTDKRIAEKSCNVPLNTALDMSDRAQEGICYMFEARLTWSIVYEWQGISFFFPVSHENMLNILKRRDFVGKRRETLPTTVERHTRNGKTIERHTRNVWNADDAAPITMNGREYKIFIAPEIYSEYWLKTARNKKRMEEFLSKGVAI